MIVQPPLYRNTFSLHQGCNGGQLHGTLFILAGHHQTGQPGRQGKSGHPFSRIRQASILFRRTQGSQQIHGPLHHQGGRNIQPTEIFRYGDAPGSQIQNGSGQIHPETFGRVKILLPGLFRLTPQPETAPRSHAPGTARALSGGRLGNLHQMQRIHPPVRIPSGPADQPGINHRTHSLNRQGSFRHISGNNDTGDIPPLHGAILLLRRQRPVKGKNVPAAHPRLSCQQLHRFPYLIHARHKYQHIPAVILPHRLPHNIRRLLPYGGRSHPAASVTDQAGSPVNDFHGILPALRFQNPAGTSHIFPQPGHLQCGGHHDHGQIPARPFLQIQHTPQG